MPPIISCPNLGPDTHVLLCPRLPDVPAFGVHRQGLKDVGVFQNLADGVECRPKPDNVGAVLNNTTMHVGHFDFFGPELKVTVSERTLWRP